MILNVGPLIIYNILYFHFSGEKFTVNLQTLSKGTDGGLRIRFVGIFGDSGYVPLGDDGFFSQDK